MFCREELKGVIIEVDIYSAIRTRYSDGESMRSIAKDLGISRQTVKKYCEGATHPEVRKNYQREPDVITDKIKAFILSCFKEDEDENLKKQKHTAKRIYDRLIAEKRFIGSFLTPLAKRFKLIGVRRPYTSTVKRLDYIPFVVDYVIAVTFLFKCTKLPIKKLF